MALQPRVYLFFSAGARRARFSWAVFDPLFMFA